MALHPGTRTKRGMRRRLPRIGMLAVLGLLACAASAQAWSQPSPVFTGAARTVFSVAGDNSGNAFAVLAGESSDLPLVLVQRSATGEDPFIWSTLPFPGGQRIFTTPGHGLDSFTTSASGDGAGLIAWRDLHTGGATLKAMSRETPQRFDDPLTLAGPAFSPRAGIQAAINPSGDAVLAFTRGGAQANGRTAVISRRAPGQFRQPKTLSKSATTANAAAIGGDGAAVVAWIRSKRVESARIGGDGSISKTQVIGHASGAGLTTALSPVGAGVVAWQDEDGAVRVVRRSQPGRFSLSLPVRLGSRDALVDGFSSAVDIRGRAFVAWRERRGQQRALYAATAPVGGEFRVTQLVSGKSLGMPSMAARPSAGAVVSWRSPAGWQARIAARNGAFAAVTTVSKPLDEEDQKVARAAALAGPGARVDLFWPQATPEQTDSPGDFIYGSFDLQEPNL